LTGCGTSDKEIFQAQGRDIPGPPSYLVPVTLPDESKMASVEEIAASYKNVCVIANKRIISGSAAWRKLQADLKATKPK
jgi:hypothetical protein